MPVNDVLGGLRHLVPELALTFGFLLVLLWDLFSPRAVRAKGNAAIALLTLAVAAGDPLTRLAAGTVPSISIFSGQLAIDAYSDFFRVLFALITAIVVLMATVGPPEGFVADAGDKVLRNNSVVRNAHGELVALLLVVTLGMNLMAMARSLLMVYMGVEIVSVISFALAGFKFSDRKSSEGALKYVIFGGVASGIMLYGMSWLYGLTGSLNLGTIANQITVLTHEHAAAHMPHALFVAGICVLVGLGYKISAVPFHMWTPDVYEGSPTLITAFFSVGPKAAGFATLVRFLHEALRARSVVAGDLDGPWPFVIGLLALATMTVGNLMALRQTNVKRLLAFSGIGHVGYMLAALAVFSDAAVASVGFYLVAYCLMNLGAFFIVMAVAERSDGDESIKAFQGLGVRGPGLALLMAVFLFSLAGIPPFVGFVGKFYVFAALLSAGGAHQTWYLFLALAGLLNSVIGLSYYARILKAMYLGSEGSNEAVGLRLPFGLVTVGLALPILITGVYWGPLYDAIARSLSIVH